MRDPHFRGRGLFDVQASATPGRVLPAATVPVAPALRRSPDEARAVPEIGTDAPAVVEAGSRTDARSA